MRSRKQRSASSRFLYPTAAPPGLMCGSLVAIKYFPSDLASAFTLDLDHEASGGLLGSHRPRVGMVAQGALGPHVRGAGLPP